MNKEPEEDDDEEEPVHEKLSQIDQRERERVGMGMRVHVRTGH